MPRPAKFRPLPLPRGWPRRVRSAVVQVISLARTSLALTQSWASESMNRELRRRAEGDRLQTLAQTARVFLVSPLTIASRMGRLDEEGLDALVRLPEPVNKFPDFVSYVVRRLKILFLPSER